MVNDACEVRLIDFGQSVQTCQAAVELKQCLKTKQMPQKTSIYQVPYTSGPYCLFSPTEDQQFLRQFEKQDRAAAVMCINTLLVGQLPKLEQVAFPCTSEQQIDYLNKCFSPK